MVLKILWTLHLFQIYTEPSIAKSETTLGKLMPNICETLSWCSNSISHSFATAPWKNKWRARSTSAPSSNICCYLSIQTSWTGRHIFFIPAVCKQLLLLLQCARTMSESSGYADMRFGETILVLFLNIGWGAKRLSWWSKLCFPLDGAVESGQKGSI